MAKKTKKTAATKIDIKFIITLTVLVIIGVGIFSIYRTLSEPTVIDHIPEMYPSTALDTNEDCGGSVTSNCRSEDGSEFCTAGGNCYDSDDDKDDPNDDEIDEPGEIGVSSHSNGVRSSWTVNSNGERVKGSAQMCTNRGCQKVPVRRVHINYAEE